MLKKPMIIQGIPAILWGKPSDNLFIAIHGNMSKKDDDGIIIFAEEAINKGYQTLSFDLPEHGDRANESYLCNVQNCVKDLNVIYNYANTISNKISIFACSLGAYFSLLAYRNIPVIQSLFLSPVLNMERLIRNIMEISNITEKQLADEKEIDTPTGHKLYWDYYSYVKSHSIDKWDKRTAILHGSNDDISELDVVKKFVENYQCKLKILEDGEHYFHTKEQLKYFRLWLRENITNI